MPKLRSRGILSHHEVPLLPSETHAETFYYEKQLEAGTRLKVALSGGQILSGVLRWYDESALGLEDSGTDIVVARIGIKYLWKEEEERPTEDRRRPSPQRVSRR